MLPFVFWFCLFCSVFSTAMRNILLIQSNLKLCGRVFIFILKSVTKGLKKKRCNRNQSFASNQHDAAFLKWSIWPRIMCLTVEGLYMSTYIHMFCVVTQSGMSAHQTYKTYEWRVFGYVEWFCFFLFCVCFGRVSNGKKILQNFYAYFYDTFCTCPVSYWVRTCVTRWTRPAPVDHAVRCLPRVWTQTLSWGALCLSGFAMVLSSSLGEEWKTSIWREI